MAQQTNTNETPENPGSELKAQRPDPDRTAPDSEPRLHEELEQPISEGSFSSEHTISPDHAEPTDVTETSNDNEIEGDYIDVGGGG